MSKLDDILAIGVPYMNDKWAQFPDEQWHMLEGFRQTEGFLEAKQAIKDLMLELVGNEPQVYSNYLVVRHKLGLEENQEQARLLAKAAELYQKELREKVQAL